MDSSIQDHHGHTDDVLHKTIDLSSLAPIFVLPLRLSSDQLIKTEDTLTANGAPLTYDVSEARIFIGRLEQKRRALFELRSFNIQAEEVVPLDDPSIDALVNEQPPRKRQRRDDSFEKVVISLDDSTTESEPEQESESRSAQVTSTVQPTVSAKTTVSLLVPEDELLVIGLSWLEDSLSSGTVKLLEKYTIFRGRRSGIKALSTDRRGKLMTSTSLTAPSTVQSSILARARSELGPERGQTSATWASSSQHNHGVYQKGAHNARTSQPGAHIPALIHQTTSEHEFAKPTNLPPMPDWVLRHSTYSCERSTPTSCPNEPFIEQLKIIRTARKLTADEIGVRAYSTSIASIAAYPHVITNPAEILALPGCEGKIAALWAEWYQKNRIDSRDDVDEFQLNPKNGEVLIEAASAATDDAKLKVLRLFYEIWGVGDKTARDFYNNGWRDLDDVVEFGWSQLSRVQQIGVKYYDEFQRKIPRKEVEFIARKIHEATETVCKDAKGVRSTIVGGYRRGKAESGDVDVIVTHLDDSETIDLIQEIVRELVNRGWITHELSTSLSGSRRGQATLPYRGAGGGHGFDTLDKALVVWQDPHWPGRAELAKDLSADDVRRKNPNVHRRVDIIIAPWSKIGCAILGWSAGTTFERDLRRYAKNVKGWKFDSSGVRDRATGKEIDLEGVGGNYETPEEAEKRVFKGFGLVYREPWERCTG